MTRRGGRELAGALCLLLAMSGCGRGSSPGHGTEAVGVAALPPGVLPWVGRVVIDWTRSQAPEERIRIGRAGFVEGPPEGPSRRYLLTSHDRREDLRFFAETFAPFTWSEGSEELIFRGAGTSVAGVAEREMVREWLRWAMSERQLAEAGSPGAAASGGYGLVFSWQRSPEGGGCDQLTVDRVGIAHAGSCNGPEELRGRLGDEALRRLYAGFDAWAPFQATSEGGAAVADSAPTADAGATSEPAAVRHAGRPEPQRLVFAGRGSALAPVAEQAALATFAASLFRELAARRSPQPQVGAVPDGARWLRQKTPPPSPEVPTVVAPASPPPVPVLPPDHAAQAAGDERRDVGQNAG